MTASGANPSKISRSTLYDAEYYRTAFDHFKSNLQSSDALITIGYGFRDTRINEYIKDFFCNSVNRPLFVVDVEKPSTDCLDRDNSYFLDGGVSKIDVKSIIDKMRA